MQSAEISVIYSNNFNEENDNYFVFEANDDVLKSLKQGEKLTIKSNPLLLKFFNFTANKASNKNLMHTFVLMTRPIRSAGTITQTFSYLPMMEEAKVNSTSKINWIKLSLVSTSFECVFHDYQLQNPRYYSWRTTYLRRPN